MGALEYLERAASIHTKGMMKGLWKKKTEESCTSQFVFKSQSHPNYKLTFTKTYLVEVSEGEEKKMYHYFWDPVLGYLCERRFLKGEGSLAVEILKFEINDSANQEVKLLEKQIAEHRRKYEDLKKQVQSLQYICENQEQTLVGMAFQKTKDGSAFENVSQLQKSVAMPSQSACLTPFAPVIPNGSPFSASCANVNHSYIPVKTPNCGELYCQPSVVYHPTNKYQQVPTPSGYVSAQQTHFIPYPRLFEQSLVPNQEDQRRQDCVPQSLGVTPLQQRSVPSKISSEIKSSEENSVKPIPVTNHNIPSRDPLSEQVHPVDILNNNVSYQPKNTQSKNPNSNRNQSSGHL